MQTYDEMVDSGVDWIGSIPKDWAVKKVKRIFVKKNDKSTTKDPVVLSLARTGVKVRDISSNEGQLAASYDNYNPVEPGDVLLNPMDLQSGANCSISKVKGVISPAYVNLRPISENNSQFFDYYFKLQYWSRAFFVHGRGISYDNRWTLGNETLMNYPVVVPAPQQQQKIADFLDTETAQIDNLIAKQERLLELLEEKRRATITHAVTRGLDSSVELKETNIPWLAQIPAHWNVKRIKDLFSANDEALGQKTDPNYGFDYVDISSVDKYRGIIKKEKMTFEKSPSRARRIVREGDIIIGAVRTYLEAIAQISEDATSLIVSTGFVVLRPKDVGDSDFYFYALRSGSFKANVVANSDGVSYPAINADKLMSLQIAVPPKEEMRTIIEHCKLEMSRMDELKQKIQTQITLLRERRTSLISHAVTGKVRV